MRKVYHIVYNRNFSRWELKAEHSSSVIRVSYSKDDLIAEAVQMCHNNKPSQLKIHLMNGLIESERTYGDDPFPPRG